MVGTAPQQTEAQRIEAARLAEAQRQARLRQQENARQAALHQQELQRQALLRQQLLQREQADRRQLQLREAADRQRLLQREQADRERRGYPTSYAYNNTYSPRYYQPSHYRRPEPSYYRREPSSGNFLTGLFAGTMLGRMFNQPRYERPGFPDNAAYMPDQPQGMGTGEPLRPGVFNSMMDAAVNDMPNTRINARGEEVPTTEEERRMFKQVVYNMLTRAGVQVNPEDFFIRGILEGQNRMPEQQRGTHITHFNDNFLQQGFGDTVDANFEMLQSQYASEYRQFQQYRSQQQAPVAYERSYPPYQQASFMPRATSFIRLF